MSLSSVSVLVALALFIGCGADRSEVGSSENSADIAEIGDAPASTSATDPGMPGELEWFVDRAEETGLDFRHFNGMSGEFYFPEIMPPGVGLLDYDNDGDLDVYLVQGQMLGAGKTLGQALVQPHGPLPVQALPSASVRIDPTAIAFTRTLGAKSWASSWVMNESAALAVP